MLRGFVRGWGWTAFAGLSSLVWALPLAAWAGAVDFDRSAWSLAVLGGLLFPIWAAVAWRARRWRVPGRYRWEPAQMSRAELRWSALAALAATGVIGWLNAAATVDWRLLRPGLAAGRPGPWVLLVAALALLAGLAVAALACWRRASAAYGRRGVSPSPE